MTNRKPLVIEASGIPGQLLAGDALVDSGGNPFTTPPLMSAAIDTAFGSAQGDILYRDAAVWKVLAPGTAGQVLSTGGAAANPSWVAAGGGGGGAFALLSSQTVAAVAAVNFTSVISATYDQYVMQFFDVVPSANNNIGIQFSTNNGSTYQTTGYNNALTFWGTDTNFSAYSQSSAVAYAQITIAVDSAPTVSCVGEVKLFGFNGSTLKKSVMSDFNGNSSANLYMGRAAGFNGTITAAVNAFRVIAASGTLSGTFRLYGVSH